MANLAFNAAQCTDPSYVEAWIGQATIAEMFAHDEAMDLYRHSNELGSHVRRMLVFEVACLWRAAVWCDVVRCDVMLCGVVWCGVM